MGAGCEDCAGDVQGQDGDGGDNVGEYGTYSKMEGGGTGSSVW